MKGNLDSLIQEEATTGTNETELTEKLYLPLISGASSGVATQNESSTAVAAVAVIESDVMQKSDLIMREIDREFFALLTPEQKDLFAKTPLAQAGQEVQSSSVQGVTSTSTCYWGGRYGARGYYYATWARYFGYYDWKKVNNTYSYKNYFYNHYAKERGQTGAIYASGAYMLAVQNLNPGRWDETAVNHLRQARTHANWDRYYANKSWSKGSTYWGRAAYYRANFAHYYFNLGVSNMNSC